MTLRPLFGVSVSGACRTSASRGSEDDVHNHAANRAGDNERARIPIIQLSVGARGARRQRRNGGDCAGLDIDLAAIVINNRCHAAETRNDGITNISSMDRRRLLLWTIISGIAGTYEEALGQTDKLLRGRARHCG